MAERIDANTLDIKEKVVSLNSSCDFAHNSLGQIYYNNSDYSKAKSEFRKANNKNMYSKAVKELRSEWIYKNIGYIIAAVLILSAAAVLNGFRKRNKKNVRRGK